MNVQAMLLVALAVLPLGCRRADTSAGRQEERGVSADASERASDPDDRSETADDLEAEAARQAVLLREESRRQDLRADQAPPVAAVNVGDVNGWMLAAQWSWVSPTWTGAAGGAPSTQPSVSALAEHKGFEVQVVLSERGATALTSKSAAFPLPMGSELRADGRRAGSVLIWPDTSKYRVLPRGMLRSVLDEQRADAMPLVSGVVKRNGGGRRLGLETQWVEVTSVRGSLRLEMATLNAGDGAATSDPNTATGPSGVTGAGAARDWCLWLVELAGVQGSEEICPAHGIPVQALYTWNSWNGRPGGTSGVSTQARMVVTALDRRTDLVPTEVLVPPPGPRFVDNGLPRTSGVYVTTAELSRHMPSGKEVPGNWKPEDDAPGEGILAVNRGDVPMYLLVDGILIAQVPAREERLVLGLRRGSYRLSWRSFLGDYGTLPNEQWIPARVEFFPQAPQGKGQGN